MFSFALFGKRTEVRGARRRFINLELNDLLERLEQFESFAFLAMNLRLTIDQALLIKNDH